jgi:hypothetical protein
MSRARTGHTRVYERMRQCIVARSCLDIRTRNDQEWVTRMVRARLFQHLASLPVFPVPHQRRDELRLIPRRREHSPGFLQHCLGVEEVTLHHERFAE